LLLAAVLAVQALMVLLSVLVLVVAVQVDC
jgi:hypothetical protein